MDNRIEAVISTLNRLIDAPLKESNRKLEESYRMGLKHALQTIELFCKEGK